MANIEEIFLTTLRAATEISVYDVGISFCVVDSNVDFSFATRAIGISFVDEISVNIEVVS